MKVRGWLMIGPQSVVSSVGMLAQPTPISNYLGAVPNVMDFQPGAMIWWTPAPGGDPVTLVCVEVPLQA